MKVKRRNKTILILFMVILIFLSVFTYNFKSEEEITVNSPYNKINNQSQITNYIFDLNFEEKTNKIIGEMTVLLPNNSKDNLEELYFHLYPNAFANWKWEEEKKPESEGFLTVSKAYVNQFEVFPHQNDTLLRINLPVALKPNEIAEVKMSFELKLPNKGIRLTHFNDTIFLAQWYPMLAVYNSDGWHLDPYTTTGDPFFSDIADYEVHLTLPKGYYVASTAVEPLQNPKQQQQLYLSQQNVRDFAIMITKEYSKLSTKNKNGVKVNLYYLPDQQEVSSLLLGIAVAAMNFFEDSFGLYPMEEIDVILADAGNGIAGMEYPGLVTSNPTIKDKNNRLSPAYNVVAHELAHQWWYGVVGNDQVKEPWLDEGLTSYSEYLFMEQILNKSDIDSLMTRYKQYTDDIAIKNNIGVIQSIYTYGDYYGPFVYGRPAAMLWQLKAKYGVDTVNLILQTYYKKFHYEVATTKDFIKVANDVIGTDMTSFFNEWLLLSK